jgi:hypothetical protein
MKTDHVLFLGNDINNVHEDNSWAKLVDDLIEFAGATGVIEVEDKPFPLVYEQVYLHLLRSQPDTSAESELKKRIGNWASKFSPNSFHRKFLDLGFAHVITTNYDHTLEKILPQLSQGLTNQGVVDERRYSLFRHFDVGSHKIWHIHGDVSHAESINLGYEQYSGYLQVMRSYVATGVNYRKQSFRPLLKRIENPEHALTSWVDLMFLRDIYIVGLKLDFVEMHLWWLLTYRARKLFGRKRSIRNRIVYYYPESLGGEPQTRRRLDVLRSCEVEVQPCTDRKEDKSVYYTNVLKSLKRKLG